MWTLGRRLSWTSMMTSRRLMAPPRQTLSTWRVSSDYIRCSIKISFTLPFLIKVRTTSWGIFKNNFWCFSGQKLGDRFESIVRASMPGKKVPFEPDNSTDPEKTTDQVVKNDPGLMELNWNNIKHIPRETFKKLFNGLKTNTHLQSLSLTNTGLTDGPAEVSKNQF